MSIPRLFELGGFYDELHRLMDDAKQNRLKCRSMACRYGISCTGDC